MLGSLSFLRSVSLLGTGRCGSWHCHRKMKANDQDIGENAQLILMTSLGDGTALFEITSDAQAQDGIIRLKGKLRKVCSSSKY